MQYALLIYNDESAGATMSEPERAAMLGAYGAVTQALRDSGAFLAGEGLQSTQSATTVRVRDGEAVTTDGPFAETKEQLGGFYLIECDSLDQALEWAARIPSAPYGSIEVRPVMVYDREAVGA